MEGQRRMLDDTDPDFDPWFEIAERIKDERKRAGLTRQQLASRVGVSRGTIFNWESGKRIPVEKCAALASGLDLATDDILSIHPEVPTRTRPARELPDPEETVRFTRREVTLISIVGVALVVGMGFLTWSTANANCTEIGAGDGTIAPAFRAAFDEGGGRIALGCATEDVRKWGPGLFQAIDGGDLGAGALMAPDRLGEAFVFAGELWESYRWIADGSSGDVAGYPASRPLDCDGTYLVPLVGGADGPGVLIEHASGDRYMWLSGDVWFAYRQAGGPGGPLGRPLDQSRDAEGTAGTFEGGTVVARYGEAPTVDGPAGTPLNLDSCTEVPLAVAAGI